MRILRFLTASGFLLLGGTLAFGNMADEHNAPRGIGAGYVAQLFEVSGLWVRNVGDRRQTKRSTLRVIRRIISRLNVHANALAADTRLPSFTSSPG